MKRPEFYKPVDRGFERELGKRLDHWARLREERKRERGEE
jgi:putative ATPase